MRHYRILPKLRLHIVTLVRTANSAEQLTVDFSKPVQKPLEIGHNQLVADKRRRGYAARMQHILLPEGRTGAPIDRPYIAVIRAQIQRGIVDCNGLKAGKLARPKYVAADHLNRSQLPLI